MGVFLGSFGVIAWWISLLIDYQWFGEALLDLYFYLCVVELVELDSCLQVKNCMYR